MVNKKQWTKERIFEKFDGLTSRGDKLTKANLDRIDPRIYEIAESMFSGWMNAKKAYYAYLETQADPTKNLETLVIQRISQLQEEINLKISLDDKLNKEFITYIENKDPFMHKLVMTAFGTWERFYLRYCEIVAEEQENISDEELMEEIVTAIKSEEKLDEDVISSKHSDIYNIAVKRYGTLKDAVVHFMEIKMQSVVNE